MLIAVGLWSHLLAALMFGVLAVAQLRWWSGDPLHRPLVTAFAVVSVWALFLATLDQHDTLTHLAESGRNLAFLTFMYGIMQSAGSGTTQRAVKSVYAAVAAAIGFQIVVGGIVAEYRALPIVFEALVSTSQILGLTIASGALILVHNLYGQAAPGSRNALRFPMLALALMWAYDLHLYTVAYFTRGDAEGLHAVRGVLLAALVPLFVLGGRGPGSWKLQLSRAATFQSLSVVLILAYLLAMMSASRAIEIVGGHWGPLAQLGIVLLMTAAAVALLPSPRVRAWFRVFVAKHVFEHRYDYREEWLRFTDTIGRRSEDGASLEQRVVKALADIGGSPGGVLLMADAHYRFVVAARWNSAMALPPTGDGGQALARFVEERDFVVDFGAALEGELVIGETRLPIPGWLSAIDGLWAGIPLIHSGRLVGLVLLEHPPFRRPLDWEDFDLFRAAGIQAASYIAEARSQQALADSRRFEEFNRRFAFILHDIKNLVSQLSLVARNAERHAGNPEFQADMIVTLQGSVKKLNDLLARLSAGAARESEPPRAIDVQPIVDAIVAAKRRAHPIRTTGDRPLTAKAVRAGLEQALDHLVQNAIDASPPDEPVEVRSFESGGDVAIEIVDRGDGMSEDFIGTRLFQPFASTKESGFGIGAYEARSLITAMGGRLEVESAVGEGTRFTLILPGAQAPALSAYERIRA